LVSVCWVLSVGAIGASTVVSESYLVILDPKLTQRCPAFDRSATGGEFNGADFGNSGINLPGRYQIIFHDGTVLFWVGLAFLPVVGFLVFGRAVL
jgi:hypothetical protein